jgi:hypothetical protein
MFYKKIFFALSFLGIGCVAQLAPEDVSPLEFSGDGIEIGTDEQNGVNPNNGGNTNVAASASVLNFQNTLFPVTSTKCMQCHSGNHGSSNVNLAYNSIINGGKVSLASPGLSALYLKINDPSGHQGYGPADAVEILNKIELWAGLDGIAGPGNNGNPVAVTNASLTAFASTLHPVMVNRCASCHSNNQNNTSSHGNSDATVSFETMDDVDGQGRAKVNFSNPNLSRIYTKINGGHQGMGATQAMEILTAINAWIQAIPANNGNSYISVGRRIMAPIGSSLLSGDIVINPDQMTIGNPNPDTFDRVIDEETAIGAPFTYLKRTGGNNASAAMNVVMNLSVPQTGNYIAYVLHRINSASRTYQYAYNNLALADFVMPRNTESYNANSLGNRIYYEWFRVHNNAINLTAGAHTFTLNMGRLGDARLAKVVFVRQDNGRPEFISRKPSIVGVIPMRQFVKNGVEIIYDVTPLALNSVGVDAIRFSFSTLNQAYSISGLKPLINNLYSPTNSLWSQTARSITQTASTNVNFQNQPFFSSQGTNITLEDSILTDEISFSIDSLTP